MIRCMHAHDSFTCQECGVRSVNNKRVCTASRLVFDVSTANNAKRNISRPVFSAMEQLKFFKGPPELFYFLNILSLPDMGRK